MYFHIRYPFLSGALRLKPNALSLRGLVLFLCGRLEQALNHVQSALRFDPGHERLRKRVKDVQKLKDDEMLHSNWANVKRLSANMGNA